MLLAATEQTLGEDARRHSHGNVLVVHDHLDWIPELDAITFDREWDTVQVAIIVVHDQLVRVDAHASDPPPVEILACFVKLLVVRCANVLDVHGGLYSHPLAVCEQLQVVQSRTTWPDHAEQGEPCQHHAVLLAGYSLMVLDEHGLYA